MHFTIVESVSLDTTPLVVRKVLARKTGYHLTDVGTLRYAGKRKCHRD